MFRSPELEMLRCPKCGDDGELVIDYDGAVSYDPKTREFGEPHEQIAGVTCFRCGAEIDPENDDPGVRLKQEVKRALAHRPI